MDENVTSCSENYKLKIYHLCKVSPTPTGSLEIDPKSETRKANKYDDIFGVVAKVVVDNPPPLKVIWSLSSG